ncbi:MAG: heme ABC exporter ATP-binding protein CcmA [Anaerolineae bacterium]
MCFLPVSYLLTPSSVSSPAMIAVHNLSKSFGPRIALSNVELQVRMGETVALLGPNGAGKTTLLRILATLSRPTSGTVTIAGVDLAKAGDEARRQIGFLSHRTLLYDDLTAEQNLAFYARMYDLPDAAGRIAELLQRVGLLDRRHDLVRTFSRGMQQRLALARTLLHHPPLLLLDEPYSGLDPLVTQVLTSLLAELAGQGTTILLTTHDLNRGLALAQRVVVLSRGRVVHDASQTQMDSASFCCLYERLTA